MKNGQSQNFPRTPNRLLSHVICCIFISLEHAMSAFEASLPSPSEIVQQTVFLLTQLFINKSSEPTPPPDSATPVGPPTSSPRSASGSPRLTPQQQLWMRDLLRCFMDMKSVVSLTGEQDEIIISDLCLALQSSEALTLTLAHYAEISLEGRKDFALVFCALVRNNSGDFISHLQSHPSLFDTLLTSLSTPEITILISQMLRECLKHPYLAYLILRSFHFWTLFSSLCHSPSFDVASESFQCLQDLFTLPELEEVQQAFFESQTKHFLDHYEVLHFLDFYLLLFSPYFPPFPLLCITHHLYVAAAK